MGEWGRETGAEGSSQRAGPQAASTKEPPS